MTEEWRKYLNKVAMANNIKIIVHKGKKKKFYTVHQVDDNGNFLRIFGKFSNMKNAKKRAEEVKKAVEFKYNLKPKIINIDDLLNVDKKVIES